MFCSMCGGFTFGRRQAPLLSSTCDGHPTSTRGGAGVRMRHMRCGYTPDLEPWFDGRAAIASRPACRLAHLPPGGAAGWHPAGKGRLSRLTAAAAAAIDSDPEEVLQPTLTATPTVAATAARRWPARHGTKRRRTHQQLEVTY